jgi:hypothetical protein
MFMREVPASGAEEPESENQECDCPPPAEGSYDSTVIEGRYYAKLWNQTQVTFSVDVWRDGAWRDEYAIPAGEEILVEAESEQLRVRICECETLTKVGSFWTLKVWRNYQSRFASYTFYNDGRKGINLKATSR